MEATLTRKQYEVLQELSKKKYYTVIGKMAAANSIVRIIRTLKQKGVIDFEKVEKHVLFMSRFGGEIRVVPRGLTIKRYTVVKETKNKVVILVEE